MKKLVISILAAMIAQFSFGQIDSLRFEKEISSINNRISIVDTVLNNQRDLKTAVQLLQSKIDSLYSEMNHRDSDIEELSNKLNKAKTKFNQSISSVEKSTKRTIERSKSLFEEKLSLTNKELDSTLKGLSLKIETTDNESKKVSEIIQTNMSQKVLIFSVVFFILLLLVVIVYLLLNRNIKSSDNKLISKLDSSRKLIEEEGVKIDNKLLELIEKQISVINIQNENVKVEKDTKSSEPDHSLALKVADEITRIQKNLSKMDEGVKGKKQLNASVERIRSNFEANDYEIVDMLNKPYKEGMKVDANFRIDDTLESNEQIITRIIKPQVNYKGEMIQAAQIEVSQGE